MATTLSGDEPTAEQVPSWAELLDEHRSRTRAHIAEVGMALIAERGMSGVSMSLLAQRAGISRATLYHYFRDLEQVMLGWLELQVASFAKELTTRASAIPDPTLRLREIISTLVTYFSSLEHRMGIENMGGEALSPKAARAVAAQVLPITHLIASAIQEGQGAGSFRGDADPLIHADLILGLMGAIRPHLVSGRYNSAEASRAIAELVLGGVRNPNEEP
ncbi:MAG: TetR/AcrR family transcriptional regulator [Candidatus Dormibacteraeota bacterium]|nr:TetR/AcrR family transcriptional regulator [Candidatus Dormibacteraeota bacterium]